MAGTGDAAQAQVLAQPTPAPAPTPAPPLAALTVHIPQGLETGQRVAFTAPDGQRLVVATTEPVAPGGSLQVTYQPVAATATPPPLPPAPLSAAQQRAAMDRQASQQAWMAYALSICCCLMGPLALCAPVIWLGIALFYFTKPREQRRQGPMQRTPAVVALSTCLVTLFISLLCVAGAVGFGIGFSAAGGMMDLHGHEHDWRKIDWDRTFDACPAWGAYARAQCPRGPDCNRPPTLEESEEIKVELSQNPCRRVATQTSALAFAEWWDATHHEEKDEVEEEEEEDEDDAEDHETKTMRAGEGEGEDEDHEMNPSDPNVNSMLNAVTASILKMSKVPHAGRKESMYIHV